MPSNSKEINKSFVGDDDLYRSIIMDHYARPRHKKTIPNCTHSQEGFNPSCGDEVSIELILDENNTVQDIGFQGQGCSISIASASMLTDILHGKTLEEVKEVTRCFKERMLSRETELEESPVDIGDLEALDGVRFYPVRIKCALLVWNTMIEALDLSLEAHKQ